MLNINNLLSTYHRPGVVLIVLYKLFLFYEQLCNLSITIVNLQMRREIFREVKLRAKK